MGKQLYELREMLMDELQKISSKGELTAGSLETVDKLTHSIKSIDTICAMEEAGEYSYDNGMSYARSRGSNARRDSMGRYASDSDMTYARRNGRYSRRSGYAYDSKEELVESLRELMEEADDNKSKQAIKHAIQQLEE